jgi:hypothetical protein
VKILMMEAAALLQPTLERQSGSSQKECMDTLLLLAHKPAAKLKWMNMRGEACCNTQFRIKNLAEKALQAYIHLNIRSAMRDSGSNVCAST